jgi:hypothetical protein
MTEISVVSILYVHDGVISSGCAYMTELSTVAVYT